MSGAHRAVRRHRQWKQCRQESSPDLRRVHVLVERQAALRKRWLAPFHFLDSPSHGHSWLRDAKSSQLLPKLGEATGTRESGGLVECESLLIKLQLLRRLTERQCCMNFVVFCQVAVSQRNNHILPNVSRMGESRLPEVGVVIRRDFRWRQEHGTKQTSAESREYNQSQRSYRDRLGACDRKPSISDFSFSVAFDQRRGSRRTTD